MAPRKEPRKSSQRTSISSSNSRRTTATTLNASATGQSGNTNKGTLQTQIDRKRDTSEQSQALAKSKSPTYQFLSEYDTNDDDKSTFGHASDDNDLILGDASEDSATLDKWFDSRSSELSQTVPMPVSGPSGTNLSSVDYFNVARDKEPIDRTILSNPQRKMVALDFTEAWPLSRKPVAAKLRLAPPKPIFTKFRQLPPEMRLKVWQESAKLHPTVSRIVELDVEQYIETHRTDLSISASPRTHQNKEIDPVCREARFAARDLHNIHISSHIQIGGPFSHEIHYTGSLYFDFDRDILYLNTAVMTRLLSPDIQSCFLLRALPETARNKVRVLAINCDWDVHGIPDDIFGFANLEVLIMILEQDLSRSARPNQLKFIDVTTCERHYFTIGMYKNESIENWLRMKPANDTDSKLHRREIWLAHAGTTATNDICHYGTRVGASVWHPQTIQRKELAFSDEGRELEWWRRTQWTGALGLMSNGQIDYGYFSSP